MRQPIGAVGAYQSGVSPNTLVTSPNTNQAVDGASINRASSINSPAFLTVLSQLLESGQTMDPATLQSLVTALASDRGNGSGSSNNSTLSITTAEWLVSQMMQSLPEPGVGLANDSSGYTNALSIDPSGTSALFNVSGSMSPSGGLLGPFTAGTVQTEASVGSAVPAMPTGSAAAAAGSDEDVTAAIRAAAAKYGVPENIIRGVVQQESGRNPRSVSPAGAMGLMQLMPATANELGVTNPFDPVQNVDGGTRYLAGLLKDFDGNVSLALAAYNAGPAAVRSHGGIPPYPETQNYVQSVLALSEQYGR